VHKDPQRNKEKERMREREREARDREARYSNGHLFNSLTVSGTTLCSACNKSITAKEALSCPTCNVTIHNRCRDTLPNCIKMKQKQQKMALVRNNSAYQNVTLRNKAHLKERPNSAIYPSDSLRQSLLGSRRGRSSLLLSKSVSTNNIAGTLNDDSPLGLRRILSQSTDSLNFRSRTMSMESLNDEGEGYFTSLLDDLEFEGREFEADSWSMAVDSTYLQTHRKDVIKRQDVIYELIQTELHHVRTLRIMDGVFRRGMLEEVQLEPGVVHALFPCLERLLMLHTHFLTQLLTRRTQSLQPDSTYNFTITQISDLLIQQFSGQCADEMLKVYSEFCSRHMKAVKLYKELLARDKRLQLFIRRASRGPLLRRHGFQECILLVTQRITKYPVLLQRIYDNTKGKTQEAEGLSQALSCIRELLCSVDQQVLELERTQRLQEIRSRVDPRSEAKLRSGALFRPAELLRRQLIHEGTLLWKTPSSRLKDVQVMLMTDILVFMQEKDQRFIFASFDKSAVVSLQSLLVRDIANQERGLFLISSESSPPEMYELYAASKDDRNTWIRLIQQTISRYICPSREEFPLIETEDKALLRRLKADIQQKDREVLELLQERVTLFSDLAEVMGGYEVMLPSCSRNLFRAESPQAPHGEQLLTQAITEGKTDRMLHSGPKQGVPPEVGFTFYSVSPATAGVRTVRSLSRDGANDFGSLGDLALLQRQHSLLQEELGRLRGAEGKLRDSERARAQLEKQLRDLKTNSAALGDAAGSAGSQLPNLIRFSFPLFKAPSTRRESDTDPNTDTPLASQESMDQSDGLQECSDVEVDVISDDDDDDGDDDDDDEVDSRVSPRSESPRGL
uniref:Rho guanine nucleotide exchange factor (GEF) 2a n=2 Tax=Cyprinus carpio TaxID=7962 RepID=A0A8C1BWX6_CYPCA